MSTVDIETLGQLLALIQRESVAIRAMMAIETMSQSLASEQRMQSNGFVPAPHVVTVPLAWDTGASTTIGG